MENETNLHINYLLSSSVTAHVPLRLSDVLSHNQTHNQFEVCSLEEKIEHSNVINQEIDVVTNSQKFQEKIQKK